MGQRHSFKENNRENIIERSGLQRAAQMTELFREQMEASLSLNKQPDEEAAEYREKLKAFSFYGIKGR